MEIRRRLLLAFEYAEKLATKPRKAAAMTFVIIGGGRWCGDGGPSRKSRATPGKDFKHIDPASARVHPGGGDERVVSSFHEDLSAKALEQLKELGVEVRTGIHAKNRTEAGLEVGDDSFRAV